MILRSICLTNSRSPCFTMLHHDSPVLDPGFVCLSLVHFVFLIVQQTKKVCRIYESHPLVSSESNFFLWGATILHRLQGLLILGLACANGWNSENWLGTRSRIYTYEPSSIHDLPDTLNAHLYWPLLPVEVIYHNINFGRSSLFIFILYCEWKSYNNIIQLIIYIYIL